MRPLCCAVALAGFLALPACDTVPDALNPWAEEQAYQPETEIDTSRVPGEDEPYPNLATVPNRPDLNYDKTQRKALVEGLIADRDNAVYSDGTGPGRAAGAGEAPNITPAKRETVAAARIEPAAGSEAERLGTIVFSPGASDLPSYATGIIAEIAEAQRSQGGTLQVVGHAGSEQNEDRNARLELAANRAQVVAIALMQQGIPRDKVVTTANADGIVAEDTGGARADIYLGR